MSMISAQCDELRELATRYDELQAGAVKAVTMPSDMGSILRNAADTIWELRDSVHRERAEADRLRELVKDMWPHVRHRSRMCGECELPCDTSDECLLYEPMRQRMRELGVEVEP